jgi:DUF1365 family protein
MTSALYRGHLLHARWRPIEHRFRYPLFQFLVDVDEIPELARRLRLFSHNRPNLFSLHDRDYLGAAGVGIGAAVRAYLRAEGADPGGRILALTHVRLCGYVFNPVTFYYCMGPAGELGCVVAEVRNTFGDSHRYLCDARAQTGPGVYRHDKLLHVSPFVSMDARYEFHFPRLPAAGEGSPLEVRMDEWEHGQRFFAARLTLARRELSDRALVAAALRYPFMTAQVIAKVHYQALKLYLEGAPFHHQPPYDPEAARSLHARKRESAAHPLPHAPGPEPAGAPRGAEGAGPLAPRPRHPPSA